MSNVMAETEGRRLIDVVAAPPDRRPARAGRPAAAPAWIEAARRDALDCFSRIGLPSTSHEEWRYTNLKALTRTPFVRPEEVAPVSLSPRDIAPWRIEGMRGPVLVFVNGAYAPALSSVGTLPRGAVVTSLRQALESGLEGVEGNLTALADCREEAFTALNTALLEDGAFISIPRGVVLQAPIHLVNVAAAPRQAIVISPRTLIVTGESSAVTVIEDYIGGGEEVYFTNAVTEVIVGRSADVHHYMLERESARAFNVSALDVRQERDSRFASHSVLLGGALVRNNVSPVLDGENSLSLLNGLYIGRRGQHLDNHMRVVHAKGHCRSRQYYKGILDDDSHGVFTGRIIVAQDAQKTDAVQRNANLLLSQHAQAQTRPQLEIYADDVKCTHGATVGALDEGAVFYLRSRGLSEPAARRLLVHAFAGESLERMEVEALREALGRMIGERLAG